MCSKIDHQQKKKKQNCAQLRPIYQKECLLGCDKKHKARHVKPISAKACIIHFHCQLTEPGCCCRVCARYVKKRRLVKVQNRSASAEQIIHHRVSK